MGGPKNKGYKRSWKNLLLNKQYQLSFTLLMVGVSALLMAGLGFWVNREAQRATQIFLNDVKDCRVAPAGMTGDGSDRDTSAAAPADERPRAEVDVDVGEMKMVDPNREPAPDGDAPVDPDGDPPMEPGVDAPKEAPDVSPPPPETAPAATIAAPEAMVDRTRWPIDAACQKTQAHRRQELLDGQRLILYVLIGVGVLLMIGLTLFGIKMTHKVAGPLHKVSLYLAKMRDGKYDTVYNLRKGDQLVDFYEHFKGGHAGVKKMQQEDLERLSEILDAADEHKLADKSPELAAAIEELKQIAKRKEEGLV